MDTLIAAIFGSMASAFTGGGRRGYGRQGRLAIVLCCAAIAAAIAVLAITMG